MCRQQEKRSSWYWLSIVTAATVTACAANSTHTEFFDLVQVDVSSGCMNYGPIAICEGAEAARRSLLWRAFDPTSDERQSQVRQQVAKKNEWDPAKVIVLASSDPIEKRWRTTLDVVAGTSFEALLGLKLPEDALGDALRLDQIELQPALKIDLLSRDVTLDEVQGRRWIEAITEDPVLDQSCLKNNVHISCRKMFEAALSDEDKQALMDGLRQMVGSQQGQAALKAQVSYLEFRKQSHDWLKANSHHVYAVDQDGSSPQVDILGNLYIPKPLIASLTHEQLDIVMEHEAAHVILFEIDQLLTAAYEFSHDAFESDNGKTEDLFKRLSRSARLPDEMNVDLIAAEIFSMSPEKLEKYSVLLSELEFGSSAREVGLSSLGELEKAKITAGQLFRSQQYAAYVSCASETSSTLQMSPPKIILPDAARLPFDRYMQASASYEGILGASRLTALLDPKWKLDEHVVGTQIRDALLRSPNGCTVVNWAEGNEQAHVVAATVFAKGEAP